LGFNAYCPLRTAQAPEDGEGAAPRVCHETPLLKLWHKPSVQFETPKAVIYLHFACPEVRCNARLPISCDFHATAPPHMRTGPLHRKRPAPHACGKALCHGRHLHELCINTSSPGFLEGPNAGLGSSSQAMACISTLVLLHAQAYVTPEAAVLTQLFVKLLADDLNAVAYDAELAGLSYSVSNTKQGFLATFYGCAPCF
jgi:secreted Zn-dependent insulinase-like peptidase